MDQMLADMRSSGAPWDEVSTRIGVNLKTCKRRAKILGLPTARLSAGSLSGREVVARATSRKEGNPNDSQD